MPLLSGSVPSPRQDTAVAIPWSEILAAFVMDWRAASLIKCVSNSRLRLLII